MYPELHLGPVTLWTFGICFALAFLAASALAVLGWAYWRGFLNLTLLDVAAPALASWSSFCVETRAIRWDLPPRSWSLC